MTPPTLEEHRAWAAAHGRNYTDGPIKKHRLAGTSPDEAAKGGSVDNITRLIESQGAA